MKALAYADTRQVQSLLSPTQLAAGRCVFPKYPALLSHLQTPCHDAVEVARGRGEVDRKDNRYKAPMHFSVYTY